MELINTLRTIRLCWDTRERITHVDWAVLMGSGLQMPQQHFAMCVTKSICKNSASLSKHVGIWCRHTGAGNWELCSTCPCPVTSALLRSLRRLVMLPRWPVDSQHAACRAPSWCRGACSSATVTSCSTFCHSSSLLRSCPKAPQASRTENRHKNPAVRQQCGAL